MTNNNSKLIYEANVSFLAMHDNGKQSITIVNEQEKKFFEDKKRALKWCNSELQISSSQSEKDIQKFYKYGNHNSDGFLGMDVYAFINVFEVDKSNEQSKKKMLREIRINTDQYYVISSKAAKEIEEYLTNEEEME